MLFDFLAVIVPLLIRSWVVPGPTNKMALVAEFVWLVPPKKLTPARRELAFPEFCCPLFALRSAIMTKVFVPLGPGGTNKTRGVMSLVPRGAGTAVDPITLPPNDLEGGSVTVGAGAEAWALPIEGFGTMRVPPGVVAVALAAVAREGLSTTMGVPPGVVAFAALAATTAAALSLGWGGGRSQHHSVARRELGMSKLWRTTR